MNFKKWAQNLELEEDEFLELLGLFIKTTLSDLAELQTAVEAGDILPVAAAAHSIKGAAGSLGLMDIHDLARKMEVAARENHLADIPGNLRAIREKLDLISETSKGGE